MTQKPPALTDPIEKEIELALKPGAFICEHDDSWFVSGLDEIAERSAKQTKADPERAVTLYETSLACCYEKAEELDGSDGSFGQFVVALHCGWIKARKAAGVDPAGTAGRLLEWMDNDAYGFCCRIENDAAKAFDKTGLAAFVKQVRARFDGATKDDPRQNRRRWSEALRTLYLAQKNTAAYIALAEETGLKAQDCHAIATLLVGRRKPQEALAWVERGIDIDKKDARGSMSGSELVQLKRGLLCRLGRGDEALESAWADFRMHPDKYAYAELMQFVPAAERTKWHGKAIEAAEGADLQSCMDLLLERSHPALAVRLWRAQGMRIVNSGKSRYYDAALSNFENAKLCFERAGLVSEWEKTVNRVNADHRRKTGFMPGFQRLVAGTGPSDEPSFLERAKARWGGQRHGDLG